MSLDYGRSRSTTIDNTLDLRLLDPFSEDTSPLATVESSDGDDHGLLRKSTSERGSLKNARSQSTLTGRRVSSWTGLEASSSNSSLHPLRSAGLAEGPNDAGVTRPHLSRVLKVGTLVDAPPVTNNSASTPIEAMDVFIHVVSGCRLSHYLGRPACHRYLLETPWLEFL